MSMLNFVIVLIHYMLNVALLLIICASIHTVNTNSLFTTYLYTF